MIWFVGNQNWPIDTMYSDLLVKFPDGWFLFGGGARFEWGASIQRGLSMGCPASQKCGGSWVANPKQPTRRVPEGITTYYGRLTPRGSNFKLDGRRGVHELSFLSAFLRRPDPSIVVNIDRISGRETIDGLQTFGAPLCSSSEWLATFLFFFGGGIISTLPQKK